MDSKDLLQKIESLEKRLSELESLKKSNLGMFGRSYSLVGNSNSDFLIKTRGLIKVQWGNKFINLIKDGKVNADFSFIFQVKTLGDIGSKNGIYITEDGSVYLKSGNMPLIPLVEGEGNTYVSFLEKLETTSDAKYNALKNIGFLYSNLEEINETSLQNGIIYIESEKKLYIVSDGLLTEFSIELPNPFTQLLIIKKNNTKLGSLLIKGSGIENSVAFESLYIFTENGNAYLRAGKELDILINNRSFITVTNNKVTVNNILETDAVLSIGATGDLGYMLYIDEKGQSTLVVDKLIVRKPKKEEINAVLYPITWSIKNNIITNIIKIEDSDNEYEVTFKYTNLYKVNDILYTYVEIEGDNPGTDPVTNAYFSVQVLSIEPIIRIRPLENLITNDLTSVIGKTVFLISSENQKLDIIRRSENNIDFINCSKLEDEKNLKSINLRLGNLTELKLKGKDNTLEKKEIAIEGIGLYGKQGYFKKAGYTKDYLLKDDDDSTNFASTEWVQARIKSIPLPGYYYSVEQSNNLPINPEFVGTDIGEFKVSKEIPLLWKTVDGKTYILVDLYIDPVLNRIYIISTHRSQYYDYAGSLGTKSYPSGFIAYYSSGNIVKKLGKSYYLPVDSFDSNSGKIPNLDLLSTIIVSPDAGIIPSIRGYSFLWSIDPSADITDFTLWILEKSIEDSGNTVVSVDNADWGNSTVSPGYKLVEVADDGTMVRELPSSEFIDGAGNKENWNNEVWRKSFLMLILADFLRDNASRYIPDFGWTFNWDGPVYSIGYLGMWTGRMSGVTPPSSDNPLDDGYLPLSGIQLLSGWVMGNGNKVFFEFRDVLIGLQLPYCMPLATTQVGNNISGYDRKFYKVSYGVYSAIILEFENNKTTQLGQNPV